MEVRSFETAPVYTTKDGSSVRALFEFGEVARNQSLVEAALPPGGSTERHLHRRSEELYVVLEGGGEMEIERERRAVSVGDVVLIPPGARHQITATEDGPLRFLCCCSPPYRHEDTVLDA
jgi:mannose-6-phosphate isomerase-like protein (cupin superfamily)